MSIVRYRQWPAPRAPQDEIRRVFDHFIDGAIAANDRSAKATPQWMPLVDVKEEADRFVLQADLPGVDPEAIEIHMDKGILSIKGERKTESAGEAGRYSRAERHHGSFHRRFALPDSADADGIAASGRDGVLEISIPKRPEAAPRRIQVGSVQAGSMKAEAGTVQ